MNYEAMGTASPNPPGAVEAVMRIAAGFMASKHLFVGSELGLFEHLADGPLELEALAGRAGAPVRTVRIVADALVALGLLEREAERYRNAPAAAALLAGRGGSDLRPVLRLFDRITYAAWMGLARAVRTGEAVRAQIEPGDQQVLSEGIEALTEPAAAALPVRYDFEAHQRLLDLGGGTGSFLRAVLRHHAHLSGTLVDVPAVVALARERLAAAGLADRAEVVGSDIFVDDFPPAHDAVLVANVLHLMGPARNRLLLKRVREQIAESGRLLLVDFFTDPTHTRPAFAALMAGTFLTGYGEGDVYSEAEVTEWLETTGWRSLGSRVLAGPASLLIAAPA